MAGFDPEQDQQAQTEPGQTGQIMMAVADLSNPPEGAKQLAEAMRSVGYKMPFVAFPEKLQKHEFALFVGMNRL